MKPIENKTLGGILLVCGTGIGAGMLALPISTGLAGYVPTILMMEAFWLLITYSALLMLEVNLWMPDEANMITMASRTLGNWGKGIAFTFYLLLLYALTTAYLALFSNLLEDALLSYIQIPLPKLMSGVLLACLFILFVQKGTERIDTVNRCFMLGLVVTFCMLIAALFPHIDTGGEWLYQMDWHALSLGFPLIATSFGFHIIIPSLSTYLDHDVPHLKNVLISGSFVISGIYFIWLLMTLSVIPLEGEYGIIAAYNGGMSSTEILPKLLLSPSIGAFAKSFAFFAITTSFLGVSLSLWDFLKDAFHTSGEKVPLFRLASATFIPPIILMWQFPRIVFNALEFAGTFGVIILLVLMPALMVWSGRYVLKLPSDRYRVGGGKPALLFVIGVSLLLIASEFANRLGG